MNQYCIRLKHDRGIAAITTFASTMESAIEIVLNRELAPRSAVADSYWVMPYDYRLWNGETATRGQVDAYNATQDKISAFRARGKPVPDNLLNGAFNLLGHAKC